MQPPLIDRYKESPGYGQPRLIDFQRFTLAITGCMPLKIIWCGLDFITPSVVLITGLYLVARRVIGFELGRECGATQPRRTIP